MPVAPDPDSGLAQAYHKVALAASCIVVVEPMAWAQMLCKVMRCAGQDTSVLGVRRCIAGSLVAGTDTGK